MTHEMIGALNDLMQFNDNIPVILELYPETDSDIVLIESYVNYEIKKILKDIIHSEKL
jgi:molybdopterin-guanine dinucleotide biosynthesis protein